MSAPNDLIAGRYRLVHRVGRGGMGVVWEAWDERLHRRVAVKQLHAQLGLSDSDTELANLRAMREARITARLDHPHAVPVFDVVEHEGQPCLIMQFLPSTPLSEVLRERETLPLTETARIGAQIASALAAAHRAGIVHRDVKPGNVLIAEDGTARISDFGISHALGDTTLTATGMVHGTPAYLAPEVARGADSTFASDVYGLGATLYTAAEGAPPFGKDQNSIALLHRVASGVIAPPTRSGPLTPLLLRMLAANPADRREMGEVARTLTTLAAESGAEPDTLRFAEADISTVASDVRRPERPWTRGAPPTTVSAADGTAAEPVVAAAATPDVAPVQRAEKPAAQSLRQPPSQPPSQPPRQPAAGSERPPDAPAPRRRRGLAWATAAVVALLGLAIVVYALVPGGGSGRASTSTTKPGATSAEGTGSAAPRSSAAETASVSATPVAPPPTASSAATATQSASSTSDASASSEPSKTSPSPSESASASASASSSKSSGSSDHSKASGSPTAKELSRAIRSYYNLMPGNTDRGWSRLTPSYQRTRARGRSSYEGFWNDIDRVSVSRVSGDPPNRAVATIRYVYKSGRVVRETTSFQLVKRGGELKINRSTVLSTA